VLLALDSVPEEEEEKEKKKTLHRENKRENEKKKKHFEKFFLKRILYVIFLWFLLHDIEENVVGAFRFF